MTYRRIYVVAIAQYRLSDFISLNISALFAEVLLFLDSMRIILQTLMIGTTQVKSSCYFHQKEKPLKRKPQKRKTTKKKTTPRISS